MAAGDHSGSELEADVRTLGNRIVPESLMPAHWPARYPNGFDPRVICCDHIR